MRKIMLFIALLAVGAAALAALAKPAAAVSSATGKPVAAPPLTAAQARYNAAHPPRAVKPQAMRAVKTVPPPAAGPVTSAAPRATKSRSSAVATATRAPRSFAAVTAGSFGQASYPNGYLSTVGRLPHIGCTGTVVDRDVILTAAHCVWSGGGGAYAYHRNISFIPKSFQKAGIFGEWTNGRPVVWPNYSNSNQGPYDYAFVKFPPLAGRHIGDVVGSEGFLVNGLGNTSSFWSYGYPQTGDFSWSGGSNLFYCNSPFGAWMQETGGWSMRMACNMTGGASGGPWFMYWNNRWYVGSVNSRCTNPVVHCKTNSATELIGPYFDSSTLSLFNYAKAM